MVKIFRNNLKNISAFTFIELFVVILTIALISSIATYSFSVMRRTARDKKALSEVKEFQIALEAYKMIEGEYPSTEDVEPGSQLIGTNGSIFYDKISEEIFYYKTNNNYNLSFKLESDVDDFFSGYNCLTDNDIFNQACCPSSLLVYWRGEGDASDSYYNNLNGSFLGGAHANSSFKFGNSFDFSAPDSYVEISHNDILNIDNKDKTFSLWLKIDNISNRQGILYKGVEQQLIEINNNRISGYIRSSPTNIKTILSDYYPYEGEVLHLVLVIKFGDVAQWYVNGSFVNEIDISTLDAINNSSNFQIGYSYLDRYFNGLVDEVIIFDKALDSNEVFFLYEMSHPCYFN